MPKTSANKSAARQAERYRQAHQTERAVPTPNGAVRRAVQKRQAPAGFGGFIREFPWLSGILTVAILGAGLLTLRANHLPPFAIKATPDACAWAKKSSGTANGAKITRTYASAPPACITTATGNYQAVLYLKKGGNITIQLDQKAAPVTVNNFVFLATHHFYDGLTFHRVVTNPLVAQAGDPRTVDPKADLSQGLTQTPSSPDGAGYFIPDELPTSSAVYKAQSIAMANKGKGTTSSQFFISTGDNTSLPASYNYFGQVTNDTFAVLKTVQQNDVINSITITYDPKGTPGVVPATPTPTK
ncbi:MAG: peptidylprolyl isomerase [Ktedonobacterales bacterium]|nr:peptidylprolyl isomerase [Ktedonobacterales bacterium]